MKLGRAQHFFNQDPLWLIRALGLLTALIIPPYRLIFSPESFDPMWIRWLICGSMVALVVVSFAWKGLRNYANTVIYVATTFLSGWMLALALFNNLSPDYASSYFILVFTSLILYRSWTWLFAFMLINMLGALFFISQLQAPIFNPWAFFAMQFSIFAITILGLMKGFQEFKEIGERENLLRKINRASFEDTKTAILVTDSMGVILHQNQLWQDMWPVGDVFKEGQKYESWMLRVQRFLSNPQAMLEISRLATAQSTKNFIEELHLEDGRVIQLNSNRFTISESEEGRIWFFDDITVSSKTAERLKISQKKLVRQNEALVRLASYKNSGVANLEESFANITETVSKTLNIYRSSIWRYDESSETLECQSLSLLEEIATSPEPIISRAESPEFFTLLERERSIFIEDFGANPLTASFANVDQKAQSLRSRVIIPLRSNGKLFGFLSAERKGRKIDWETEEHQFLASVGDLTMVAIEAVERSKAESERRKMTALLETVFELSGVGILVTSTDRKVLNLNAQYLSIWGLEEEFALNGNPEEVIEFCRNQTLDESELSESMRFLMDNPGENDSKSIFFKDGRIVERFTEVLKNGEEVIGRVWFYRDVTTRLQSETKLIESEMRNKAILDAIPDLILRINLSGDILDAKFPENSPFEKLEMGVKAQNIRALFPQAFTEKILEKSKLALSRAMLFEVEIEATIFEKPGDYDLRLIQSGIDEVLVMIRDVTERKKTEKELVQRNHELDSFVYRASHDLKAPLNSMMGLIEILKGEGLDPSHLMYIGLMDKSVAKLDTFIRNLADFSRIARIQIQAKPVDFDALIEDVKESLFFMENASKIEKHIELKLGPKFIGDSFHIGIVLSNLVSNAIKYVDLKKENPQLRLHVETDPEKCTITVQDNGMGIPKAYQARIFELFFRASTQSFGSGLGLYITRNAIEKMNGSIDLSSDEGQGTTFTVILPQLAQEVPKELVQNAEFA